MKKFTYKVLNKVEVWLKNEIYDDIGYNRWNIVKAEVMVKTADKLWRQVKHKVVDELDKPS